VEAAHTQLEVATEARMRAVEAATQASIQQLQRDFDSFSAQGALLSCGGGRGLLAGGEGASVRQCTTLEAVQVRVCVSTDSYV